MCCEIGATHPAGRRAASNVVFFAQPARRRNNEARDGIPPFGHSLAGKVTRALIEGPRNMIIFLIDQIWREGKTQQPEGRTQAGFGLCHQPKAEGEGLKRLSLAKNAKIPAKALIHQEEGNFEGETNDLTC